MTGNPEPWRDEPHGMRVTRFDHSNLYRPNIDRVVEFFTELVDFSLTETAETPDGIGVEGTLQKRPTAVVVIYSAATLHFVEVKFMFGKRNLNGTAPVAP